MAEHEESRDNTIVWVTVGMIVFAVIAIYIMSNVMA